MPGTKRRTGLHCREDVHQTGMMATFFEDLLHPLFLAEGLVLANEFNRDPGLGREAFGIGAYLITQRLSSERVIEQPDTVTADIPRHGCGMTDIGQRSRDHDAVEAGDDTGDVVLMTLHEWADRHGSPRIEKR